MIEVASDRSAQSGFIARTATLRVAAFTEIRKVAHQQNADTIRVVEQHWIINLEMHSQQIEANTLCVRDVVAERLCIPGRVNSVGKEGLVKCAAKVNRFAIQA